MKKHLDRLQEMSNVMSSEPIGMVTDMSKDMLIEKPMVGGIDTNACVEAMVNGKYRVCSLGKLAKDIRDLKRKGKLIEARVYDCGTNRFEKVLEINDSVTLGNISQYVIVTSGGRYIDVSSNKYLSVCEDGVSDSLVRANRLSVGDKLVRDTGRHNRKAMSMKVKDTEYEGISQFCGLYWVLGWFAFLGSYIGGSSATSFSRGEEGLLDKMCEILKQEGFISDIESDTTIIDYDRGKKGKYQYLRLLASTGFSEFLREFYDGELRCDRVIPDCVFNWSDSKKLSYLSGIIDSRGHVEKLSGGLRLSITCLNGVLVWQVWGLLKGLGYDASVYRVWRKERNGYGYNLYVIPDKRLLQYSQKGYASWLDEYVEDVEGVTNVEDSVKIEKLSGIAAKRMGSDTCKVTKIIGYNNHKLLVGIRTESGYLTVNGVRIRDCKYIE